MGLYESEGDRAAERRFHVEHRLPDDPDDPDYLADLAAWAEAPTDEAAQAAVDRQAKYFRALTRDHGWAHLPTEIRLPEVTITCAECPASATIVGGDNDRVHGQMRLWRHGWRRDPQTATDHCPTHAAALGFT